MTGRSRRRPDDHAAQSRREQALATRASVPRTASQRRRTLSQNHLRDPAAIMAYLDAVGPHDIPAIEIGAGDGALTVGLARLVPRLTAVELDPARARRLRERVRAMTQVEVVEQDVLTLASRAEPFALVGNIPFAITSRIVDWAMTSPTLELTCLITQREYARKRTGDYGRWSLNTVRSWPWWSWTLGPRIRRTSFRPVPAVDAAVLTIARRPEALVPARAEARWRALVDVGFSGVGGSLHASLSTPRHPRKHVSAAFDAAGVAHDTVVGYVTPDEWLAIFGRLSRR